MIQKKADEEEQRLTDKFSKKYPEHYKDVLNKNDGKTSDFLANITTRKPASSKTGTATTIHCSGATSSPTPSASWG